MPLREQARIRETAVAETADYGAKCRVCGHYETSLVRATEKYAHCPSCGRAPHWCPVKHGQPASTGCSDACGKAGRPLNPPPVAPSEPSGNPGQLPPARPTLKWRKSNDPIFCLPCPALASEVEQLKSPPGAVKPTSAHVGESASVDTASVPVRR